MVETCFHFLKEIVLVFGPSRKLFPAMFCIHPVALYESGMAKQQLSWRFGLRRNYYFVRICDTKLFFLYTQI